MESLTPLSLETIREAQRILAGSVLRTPLVPLGVHDAPAEIFLKLENLQPIGSFKLRGAGSALARFDPVELAEGVWTASAGNMAQGVAWCARRLNVPCTVVMPEGAPITKREAVTRLGARIISVSFSEWLETFRTRHHPDVTGHFIHAFSDPAVMAGNATIGLEIVEDLPDVDVVLVPWGGGGLCCGIASAIRALVPQCKVFACEVATAAPLAASLAAGREVDVDYTPSFVDGIGAPVVFPEMFALARQLVDGSLVASLDDVAAAVRLLVERNRVVAEGAGAAALAVALSGMAGSGKVACVVSGGNIDTVKLANLLIGQNA
jgi:threonine dehydratase